jgi:hypothetical protein
VCGNDRELLVGIALYDTASAFSSPGKTGLPDTVEILFDPLNDRIGYVQFIFDPSARAGDTSDNPHRDPELGDEVQVITHFPYPEAHSSACPIPRLRRHEWREELFSPCPITRLRCRWLFAWFSTPELFRNGAVCGFNICRNRPYIPEFSSWNYCGGNGGQDATGFGRLYAFEGPVQVTDVQARLERGTMLLQGNVEGHCRDFGLELASPTGERQPAQVSTHGGAFTAEAELSPVLGGRYRLVPCCADKPVEPAYVSVDVPSRSLARDFCLSVTYDSPMSIVANHYTPERLSKDMETWAGLGVRRIHWIEYGDWPSFWNYQAAGWADNYARTVKACGNYQAAAVRAAHQHGLEFIADLKTFDLGLNCFFVDADARSTLEDIERRHVCLIPETAAHQEWTMQSNPAWRTDASFPVARLRLYSEMPIPPLSVPQIRLLTSKDNLRYQRYRKPFEVRQGWLKRPHLRWTPAGIVKEQGGRRNWFVEFSGLKLNAPFLSVQLGEGRLSLRHRGTMLAEAWNASGDPVPLTLATNGDAKGGFFFWKGWSGWSNQMEPILQERKWNGADLGMVFQDMPNMPTMLEPAYEGARNIWLGRIAGILDRGADGVDIRTYCHHNGIMSYLKYAFAQPVCETFRSLYGRAPSPNPEDCERIRRIRGDFYTQFLRDARKLVSARGRKLVIELESGVEVPARYDCRMALPMDWKAWIEEGIADEIRLKWWTAESTFVHEQVLPLARRHSIPVHLISRCLHEGLGFRAVEMAERVIGGACAAGFSGYSFYEHQNLMEMNPEGCLALKGPVESYFHRAGEVLRQMSEQRSPTGNEWKLLAFPSPIQHPGRGIRARGQRRDRRACTDHPRRRRSPALRSPGPENAGT